MIDLLRRDPTVRSVPIWMLLALFFASFVEGLRTVMALRAANEGGAFASEWQVMVQSLAIWLPLVAFLFLGRVGQRCTRFDLALPLAAKRLWSAHLAGVVLASVAVVAAAVAGFGLRRALVGLFPGAPLPPAANVTELLVPLAATLAVTVVLIQAMNPSLYVVPPGRARRLSIVGILLGGPPLILLLALLPSFLAWFLLAAAGVQALRIQRSLPAAFAMVPRQAAHDDGAIGAVRDSGTKQTMSAAPVRGRKWRADLQVFRILCAGIAPGQLVQVPFYLVSLPLLLLWGMNLAGFPLGDEIIVLWLTLTAYLLFAFLPAPMAQLSLVDPLPVSRRKLFAMMILPSLVVVGLGYAGGTVAQSFRRPAALVEYHDGGTRLFPDYRQTLPVIRVPLRYCRIGLAGRPAQIESPWGETHPAWTHAVFRGLGLTVYSPFTPGEESSPEFLALQISRAVETVYGRSIPAEEIQARYLDPAPDGTFPLESGASTLLDDYPGLEPRGGGLRAPIVFLIVGWLFLILAAIYMRAFRATIGDGVRKGIIFGVAGALVVLQLGLTALNIGGLMKHRMLTAILDILAQTAFGGLPAGALLLWIVCVALFAPVYLLVERGFHRVEAAPAARACGITNPV